MEPSPKAKKVLVSQEFVEAFRNLKRRAELMLARIDFNGGIGEYKGGPAFAVKDLREATESAERALASMKGGEGGK